MFEKTFSLWRRIVGSESKATVVDDRRLWVRYAADMDSGIKLAAKPGSDKILAKVRDLSLGGANLLVDKPLALGQMLNVELPAQRGDVRNVLACVVRVHPEAGLWSIGCAFSRDLDHDDLESFGTQDPEPPGDDQRTWIRYACEIKAKYRKVNEPTGGSHDAEVLNISANGIGLVVDPPLETGTLVNVDLLDKDGRMQRTLLACVVHTSTRADGACAIGCNFIREWTEDELQSLLN
jgi:PilZ domain